MTGDPIEAYVDALAARLRGPSWHVRRVLAETESHLLDAADAEVAAGADLAAAQLAAVERFGSPELVALTLNNAAWRRFRRPLAREGLAVLTVLAAAGLVAMGVTAVLARILAAATSSTAVFGFPPRTLPAPSDCAHWLAVNPGAAGCRQAAALEESADLTAVLLAAGVLGLLIALALLVRRRLRATNLRILPPVLGPAIAAAAFGIGAAGCAVLAAGDAVVLGTWGSGLYWTAAATSTVAALVSTGLVVRTLPLSMLGRPLDDGAAVSPR